MEHAPCNSILMWFKNLFFFKKEKQRIVSNIAKNTANEKMQKITKQVNTIAKQNNRIQKRDAGGRKRQSSFNHYPI